jgi:hypothetical protein
VASLQRGDGPKARVIEAVLRETQAPLPLGWSLSQVAQEEMAVQLSAWLKHSEAIRYLDGLFAQGGTMEPDAPAPTASAMLEATKAP